jgi:GntR family transcriptional regulator/MocR family aminotransferase
MKQVGAGFFPSIVFEHDESSPMYRRLYDWFRSAILTGELRPGQKIPSTRYLATELRVSRITVLCAFQQLAAEGYIISSAGSGTYVSKSIPDQVTRLGFGEPATIDQPFSMRWVTQDFPTQCQDIPFPNFAVWYRGIPGGLACAGSLSSRRLVPARGSALETA